MTDALNFSRFARAAKVPLAVVQQLRRDGILPMDEEGLIPIDEGLAVVAEWKKGRDGLPVVSTPTPMPPVKPPKKANGADDPLISLKQEETRARIELLKAQRSMQLVTAARRAGELVLAEDVRNTLKEYFSEVARMFDSLAVEAVDAIEEAESHQGKVDAMAALINPILQKMADVGTVAFRTSKNRDGHKVALDEKRADNEGLRD